MMLVVIIQVKAYIFDNATGALVHTLDNPNAYDTSTNDYFGWSVAITDTYAIVGAYAEDDAGGDGSGKSLYLQHSHWCFTPYLR